MVKLLVLYGADPNAQTEPFESPELQITLRGQTAIEIAKQVTTKFY